MDFSIKTLGQCKVDCPLLDMFPSREKTFESDETRLLYNTMFTKDTSFDAERLHQSFEVAGPREKIYFKPEEARPAIVSCGGICPGINDVIRSIVMESYYHYYTRNVVGISYGYNGLNPAKGYPIMDLTPEKVKNIHMEGGTMLGSSRGGTEDMDLLMDTLEKMGINILYAIGGDGTLRGAHDFSELARSRGVDLAVVGIPKTIDNDISFIQRSFGFETAVSNSTNAIYAAHTEARGAPNGIGLVKLMGRHSGFIAASAALAINDVNFVLLPEVPFDMDGENGFLAHLEKRLNTREHAVICVAEGAGQDILQKEGPKNYDPSGNVRLDDIGLYLKDRINSYFNEKNIEINLKYIDPSYMIRSAPAVPDDSIYCAILGQHAVHAAMAGKTDLVIGQWNNIFTHVPIDLAISRRKQVDPHSRFYNSVIEATGQPVSMKN